MVGFSVLAAAAARAGAGAAGRAARGAGRPWGPGAAAGAGPKRRAAAASAPGGDGGGGEDGGAAGGEGGASPGPLGGGRGRRPNRKARGGTYRELLQQQLPGIQTHRAGRPMYDLLQDLPSAVLAAQSAAAQENLKGLGTAAEEAAGGGAGDAGPGEEGAPPLLRWQFKFLLQDGAGGPDHPLNRKVRMSCSVEALGEDQGLTADAKDYLKRLCGPRYNPETDELLLTSDRHADRDSNVRHVHQMLRDVLTEARRVFPS